MTIAPAEGLAVVVMGASDDFVSGNATVIAERILLRALAEKGRIEMPSRLNLPPRLLKSPSPGQLDSVSGYYANNTTLMRVQKQPDNSLNIDSYDAMNSWTSIITGLKLRDDNRFSSDESPSRSFSFKTAEGRQYLNLHYVTGYGHYQDDIIYGQQIAAAGTLPTPWNNRLGKIWLLTNAVPDSEDWKSPSMQLNAFENLLLANRGGLQVVDPFFSNSTAGMMLLIPQIYGRDLDAVVMENHINEEWMRLGSFLYRLQETIAPLTDGINAVNIGAEGLAEWRSVDATGVTKTVTINPSVRWKLYDDNFEQIKMKTTLFGGVYYLLFHDAATVNVF
jgi:hypothetical protein